MCSEGLYMKHVYVNVIVSKKKNAKDVNPLCNVCNEDDTGG